MLASVAGGVLAPGQGSQLITAIGTLARVTEHFIPGAATCPTCWSRYLQDQPWKRVCLPCYLRTKGKTAPPTHYPVMNPAPIEPGMMRRLVQLCHPDRHGNSEASNIATRYLLALKGGQHG